MKIYQYEGKSNVCGRNIRWYRKKKKISQKELAARLQAYYNIQLEQKSISRIEVGERFIADYELLGISKALGVDLECLFKDFKE